MRYKIEGNRVFFINYLRCSIIILFVGYYRIIKFFLRFFVYFIVMDGLEVFSMFIYYRIECYNILGK